MPSKWMDFLAKWVLDHQPKIAVIIASRDPGLAAVIRELCGAHAFTKPSKYDDLVTNMRTLIQSPKAANP
jgi:hypothetical protein